MVDQTALRLTQLADDCAERARRSTNGDSRNLYWLAARDARQSATARHMGEHGRRAALAHMMALAAVARGYEGETEYIEAVPWMAKPEPPQPEQVAPAAITDRMMNARQLAPLFGMSERGARKAIERGERRGLAGFYRDGALWLAEREAFARSRGVTDNLSAGDDANPPISPD